MSAELRNIVNHAATGLREAIKETHLSGNAVVKMSYAVAVLDVIAATLIDEDPPKASNGRPRDEHGRFLPKEIEAR